MGLLALQLRPELTQALLDHGRSLLRTSSSAEDRRGRRTVKRPAGGARRQKRNRYSGRNVAVQGTKATSSKVRIWIATKGATPLYMSA